MNIIIRLVPSQIVLYTRVPPIDEQLRKSILLVERVMKGSLEAMMEKILSMERLKNIIQSIILKKEGKVRSPKGFKIDFF